MNVRALLAGASMAVVLAVVPAGCGASDGPKVATAHGPAGPAPGGTSTPKPAKESDYDKALRYTRCMTENGVKMPDPVEGKPLPLGNSGDSWQSLSTPAFDECKRFLPATWPVKVDPNEIARHRAWGECMREHGAATPELAPDANGMAHSAPDPTQYYTPEWRAAEAACRYLGDSGTIPLSDG
jgi:hypothetical protein